jgi:DNA-binding LytR/AlgR family response regulator
MRAFTTAIDSSAVVRPGIDRSVADFMRFTPLSIRFDTSAHPTVLDPSFIAPPQHLDQVSVKSGSASMIVRTADVDWWETEGNYMRLHTNGVSYLIRATAASLERQLDASEFLRIHRRFIVNVGQIAEVLPSIAGDGIVILRNGTKLRLSRTHRERLSERMGIPPSASKSRP